MAIVFEKNLFRDTMMKETTGLKNL